jgi:serine/threonine protein phosphatase PrpC
MRDMEDAVSLRPSFCTWLDGSPMHFFAVFDGHGGPHVRHPPANPLLNPIIISC